MTSRPPTKIPTRILISRLSAHGDVLQTLPLLGILKASDPQPVVGWLVEASAAPLLENHPLIDHLHIVQRKAWLKTLQKTPWRLFRVLGEILALVGELKAQRYEVSLDVQGLLKSALWPFLAGIPQRLGYARTRENAALLYTQTLPYHDLKNPDLPAVVKFMEFGQVLGAIPSENLEETLSRVRFPLPEIPPARQQKVEGLLQGVDPALPLIIIAPGTIWPSKQWRAGYWQELIKALTRRPVSLLLIGSPAEQNLATEILAELPPSNRLHNQVGRTELADLYALLPKADIFIGLDSAPLHLAQAVADNHPQQKPRILGLFGPTGPRRTGPLHPAHRTVHTELACQPCFKRLCPLETGECMTALTPEQVLNALEALPGSPVSLKEELTS